MNDIRAISDFPLVWRWTSPTHALFTRSELAGLHPCSPAEAARIDEALRPFTLRRGLDPQRFSSVLFHSADIPISDGCAWLRDQYPTLSEQVTVSWDHVTALRTDWGFFTAHWDDFCYPSDEVVVAPDSARWLLFHLHDERFYFGIRNG